MMYYEFDYNLIFESWRSSKWTLASNGKWLIIVAGASCFLSINLQRDLLRIWLHIPELEVVYHELFGINRHPTYTSMNPGKIDSPSLEDAEDWDDNEPWLNILDRAFLYSSSRSSIDFDFFPSIERRERASLRLWQQHKAGKC